MQVEAEALRREKEAALSALEETKRASALQMQEAGETAESLKHQMEAAVARCNAINEELHDQAQQLKARLQAAETTHARALNVARQELTEQAQCLQSEAEQQLAALKAGHDEVRPLLFSVRLVLLSLAPILASAIRSRAYSPVK
jgi:hypothetical protein